MKNNFAMIYSFLKKIYYSTPAYEARVKRLRNTHENNTKIKDAKEAKIMQEVFNNQYIVQNGHFKGMKYIQRSSGSALLPKILGSYEEPIQDWIREVIEVKKYENILDIGCAEGYYAVGFAMKLPNAQIIAYDIDEEAIKNVNELKTANELQNIEIKVECNHEELNSECQPNTLIFCDIEGHEIFLLDPVNVPNLKFVDLIIESHDCFIPNITEELIERFYMTHTIRIIVDYPFRIKKYNIPKKVTEDQYKHIVDEKRPERMKIIYMERVCG